MSYSPLDPAIMRPGLPGSDGIVSLGANHDELYEDHRTYVAGAAGIGISETSASYVERLRFRLLGNLDDHALRIWVRWKVGTAGDGDVQATVGTETAAANLTSTTYTWTSFSVSLTAATSPRNCKLEFRETTGGTIYVSAFVAYLVPSAPAGDGEYASEFRDWSNEHSTTQRAISSEHIQRLLRGPTQIAVDRPACLVSLHDDVTSPRTLTTNETTFTPVGAFILFAPDAGSRTYRITANLGQASTGVPHLRVSAGGRRVDFTSGIGWQTDGTSLILRGPGFYPGTVAIKRASGAGFVHAHSIQIHREA